jgi:hypothetical protein
MPSTFPRYAARAKAEVVFTGDSGDTGFEWAAYFNIDALFVVGWPTVNVGPTRMVLSRFGTPTLRIGGGGA